MFAKLFSRITESSLMEEDIPVRYTFVMLLAIADAEGDVVGTDIAIARRLNMPVAEFQRCVGVLGTADPSSNSKDMDGKRVIPCDSERGYKVVNYIKYRELTTEFQKKTYMRKYMREYREKGKVANDVKLTKSYRKTSLNTLAGASLTSASASVSVASPGEMQEGERGPSWEQAKKWLDQWQKAGSDYTEFEARTAFLALQASGWMWGRNPVSDPRAALERQIQTDREKKQHYGPKDSKTANPRLAGVSRSSINNYAEAAKRKMAGQVASPANGPSPKTEGT